MLRKRHLYPSLRFNSLRASSIIPWQANHTQVYYPRYSARKMKLIDYIRPIDINQIRTNRLQRGHSTGILLQFRISSVS